MNHHARRQFGNLVSLNTTVKYTVATFGDGDVHLGLLETASYDGVFTYRDVASFCGKES
jgi:hypothetical protein